MAALAFPDGRTPVIDGRLDEWDALGPGLELSAFQELVAGAPPDAADLSARAWVGWNDAENRIYVAVEVWDDVHQVDRPENSATTRIFQDDALEIFVDADHSGGQYADFSDLSPEEQRVRNGADASHFVLAGPHPDGDFFVNFSAAGWYSLTDGPYTRAALAFEGSPGGPGVTRYEFSVVPFDQVDMAADFLSRGHDLRAGETIGFNLELDDFDASSELFEAKWSLSGGFNGFRLSERFTDLVLMPSDIPTAARNHSWGRIKASIRP